MGYTYVMSDIHGMGALLEKMLEKLSFSEEDVLYILGDMIDRGPDPAKVLDIASSRGNIIPLRGNHEDEFINWYDNEIARMFQKYYYNTYDILMDSRCTREKLPEYVGFMKSLPFYKKLKLEDKCFLLAHASTEEILQAWKKKDRLIWDTSMVDRKKGIPGYFSIVGHVPTFVIRGFPKEAAKIWHSPDGRLIDVDCGAVFPDLGGRLGCLCLETGEEYYLSAKEI